MLKKVKNLQISIRNTFKLKYKIKIIKENLCSKQQKIQIYIKNKYLQSFKSIKGKLNKFKVTKINKMVFKI